MRTRIALMAALVIAGLTACTTGGTATPSATSSSPSATTPALGAWTAGCTSADADAAAVVSNITVQASFAGKATPSAESGWADAITKAVKPLAACSTTHLLAVSKAVSFGSDSNAHDTAAAAIVALAKGRTLVLSGSQVGSLNIATVEPQAAAVLTAIMGTPDTSNGYCEASGLTWDILAWGDFRVSLLPSDQGPVLDNWSITLTGNTPSNLLLQDELPLQATFAELTGFKPDLTQDDLLGTGFGPWTAEVRPHLRYHWIEKDGLNFRVEGGQLRICE